MYILHFHNYIIIFILKIVFYIVFILQIKYIYIYKKQ